MFHPTQPIKTDRLILRGHRMDDLDARHDIERRPDVARYSYWEPRSREESKASLEKKIANAESELTEGSWMGLTIELAGEMIGDVSAHWISKEHQQGEIGYLLHPDQQGKGYATEAAKAMLRLGFEDFKWHRIIARADARNTASTAVMERLGMRREGLFRESEFVKNEWCDEIVYAMLADEFTP